MEKDDKILMLAKSKLRSIENLVSWALIDIEISHEKFITFWKRRWKVKENVRNVSEKLEKKQKNMRINSAN